MPSDGTSAEDIELIRRISLGDRKSFEEFYDRFASLIYSTALRILNDASDAEDVTQDIFFTIWEKSSLYDSALSGPRTWAVAMTRNRSIDRLRSAQRRFRLKEEIGKEIKPPLFATNQKTMKDLEGREKSDLLHSAVLKLSKEQQQVINLAYFKGLTQQEIAIRLGEPIGTVKARIRRGMLRLKKIVGPLL